MSWLPTQIELIKLKQPRSLIVASSTAFLATLDNQPAAAGILHLHQDSALVDEAATLPAYRGRGLQKALLGARLLHAKEQGAQYAFSRTGLGSISQANLQNMGMQLLTQSTAWRRI